MLLSLLVPSRRPHQLMGLFDSVEKRTRDFSVVEVCVKIDDDMPQYREILEREIRRRPFRIVYLSSPRLGGQFTLWVALEDLFAISNPASYFVMVVTDEGRFETYHWDDVLSGFKGLFPDHVFRLRISQHRFVSNPSYFSCVYVPECFAIFTRRWLELTESFGDCYGSDAQHQCIVYHLALGIHGYGDVWHTGYLFRDVQVHDLKFGGFEFGRDVTPAQAAAHHLRALREWRRLMTYPVQTQLAYFARRIYLYVRAHQRGIESFYIKKRPKFTVALYDAKTGHELERVSYRLSRWDVFIRNIRTTIYFIRANLYTLYPVTNLVVRWRSRFTRLLLDAFVAPVRKVTRILSRGCYGIYSVMFRPLPGAVRRLTYLLTASVSPLRKLPRILAARCYSIYLVTLAPLLPITVRRRGWLLLMSLESLSAKLRELLTGTIAYPLLPQSGLVARWKTRLKYLMVWAFVSPVRKLASACYSIYSVTLRLLLST